MNYIASLGEPLPKDYECLLSNLIEKELKLKEKSGLLLEGKYRSFVDDCFGGGINKLLDNLYYNFGKSIRLSKQTKIYYDTPSPGFITKIYPAEKDAIIMNYRPAEKKVNFIKK